MNDSPPLAEPLLRAGTRTPPRHVFQIRNRSETEEAADRLVSETSSPLRTRQQAANGTSDDADRSSENPLMFMGRPYVSSLGQNIAAAAILGAAVGLGSVIFLLTVQELLRLWWPFVGHGWMPLWITATGSLLSGIIVYVMPSGGAPVKPCFAREAAGLEMQPPVQALATILASGVLLATGTPLGPELALVSMATAAGVSLARKLQMDPRTEALWVQAALSAALGGFHPLLGPLAVHELTVTGRPDRLSLDTIVASQDGAEAVQSEGKHDYMEVLTVQVVSSTVARLVVSSIYSEKDRWFDFVPALDSFKSWHVAAAIPIGLFCGVVACGLLMVHGVAQRLRYRLSQGLDRVGAPPWVAVLLFPVVAGLVNGALVVVAPSSAGSGLAFVQKEWNAAMAENPTIDPPQVLLWTALVRVLGLGTSLGFGLLGGHVLPTLSIAMCLGLAFVQIVPVDASFLVSCCLVACPVAICPVPLTATVAAVLILQCTPEQSGPLLVASLSAWMVTGGLGLFRAAEEGSEISESIAVAADTTALPDEDDDVEESSAARLMSDDEILRGVGSNMFGSSEQQR